MRGPRPLQPSDQVVMNERLSVMGYLELAVNGGQGSSFFLYPKNRQLHSY